MQTEAGVSPRLLAIDSEAGGLTGASLSRSKTRLGQLSGTSRDTERGWAAAGRGGETGLVFKDNFALRSDPLATLNTRQGCGYNHTSLDSSLQ